MGAQQQRQHPLPHNSNPLLGWKQVSSDSGAVTWVNPLTGEEMEEYQFVSSSDQEFQFEVDSYRFRLNSPFLVATRHLKREVQRDLCGSIFKGVIYIERVPLRLSKINEIPFPDVLHLYAQAFRGFELLRQQAGPFNVTEDMIGINSAGVVKVWVNSDFASSAPERTFEGNISEVNMVQKIVHVIDLNTYQPVLPSSIRAFFEERGPMTLASALLVLQEYAAMHRVAIPSRLDCVLESQRAGLMQTNLVQTNILPHVANIQTSVIAPLHPLAGSHNIVQATSPVSTTFTPAFVRPVTHSLVSPVPVMPVVPIVQPVAPAVVRPVIIPAVSPQIPIVVPAIRESVVGRYRSTGNAPVFATPAQAQYIPQRSHTIATVGPNARLSRVGVSTLTSQPGLHGSIVNRTFAPSASVPIATTSGLVTKVSPYPMRLTSPPRQNIHIASNVSGHRLLGNRNFSTVTGGSAIAMAKSTEVVGQPRTTFVGGANLTSTLRPSPVVVTPATASVISRPVVTPPTVSVAQVNLPTDIYRGTSAVGQTANYNLNTVSATSNVYKPVSAPTQLPEIYKETYQASTKSGFERFTALNSKYQNRSNLAVSVPLTTKPFSTTPIITPIVTPHVISAPYTTYNTTPFVATPLPTAATGSQTTKTTYTTQPTSTYTSFQVLPTSPPASISSPYITSTTTPYISSTAAPYYTSTSESYTKDQQSSEEILKIIQESRHNNFSDTYQSYAVDRFAPGVSENIYTNTGIAVDRYHDPQVVSSGFITSPFIGGNVNIRTETGISSRHEPLNTELTETYYVESKEQYEASPAFEVPKNLGETYKSGYFGDTYPAGGSYVSEKVVEYGTGQNSSYNRTVYQEEITTISYNRTSNDYQSGLDAELMGDLQKMRANVPLA